MTKVMDSVIIIIGENKDDFHCQYNLMKMNCQGGDHKVSKCTNAAREARNAYQRAWRAKNPDRVREINNRYWTKKAKELQKGEDVDGSSNEDN